MKNLKRLVLMGTLVWFANSATAEEYDANSIVASVNQVWNKTFNNGDSEALAALYVKDATLSPGNGNLLSGQQEIAQLFQSFFDNGVTNHLIETLKVYQSGEQIVQVGKWKAEAVNENQDTSQFGGVLVTVIEKNQNGEWKTQSHVWNMGQ
jgi:uncharacterized protein (TIGR02246 family)